MRSGGIPRRVVDPRVDVAHRRFSLAGLAAAQVGDARRPHFLVRVDRGEEVAAGLAGACEPPHDPGPIGPRQLEQAPEVDVGRQQVPVERPARPAGLQMFGQEHQAKATTIPAG